MTTPSPRPDRRFPPAFTGWAKDFSVRVLLLIALALILPFAWPSVWPLVAGSDHEFLQDDLLRFGTIGAAIGGIGVAGVAWARYRQTHAADLRKTLADAQMSEITVRNATLNAPDQSDIIAERTIAELNKLVDALVKGQTASDAAVASLEKRLTAAERAASASSKELVRAIAGQNAKRDKIVSLLEANPPQVTEAIHEARHRAGRRAYDPVELPTTDLDAVELAPTVIPVVEVKPRAA